MKQVSGRSPAPSKVAALMSPRLFKALGDPNRIALLSRFAECSRACTVGEASECCAIDLSVVSRHLAILRDAGILESEKRGKEVYYSLRAAALAQTLRTIADALDAPCAPQHLHRDSLRSSSLHAPAPGDRRGRRSPGGDAGRRGRGPRRVARRGRA